MRRGRITTITSISLPRPHLPAYGRSEQRKFPDVVALAQILQLGLLDLHITETERAAHGAFFIMPDYADGARPARRHSTR